MNLKENFNNAAVVCVNTYKAWVVKELCLRRSCLLSHYEKPWSDSISPLLSINPLVAPMDCICISLP